MENIKNRLKLNLQLFADGGEGGQEGQQQQQQHKQEQETKSYTQQQIDEMLKGESNNAINNLLKQLGFDGDNALDDMKKAVKAQQEAQRKNNTDLENAQNDLAKEKTKAEQAEQKANLLECKVKAMQLGVKPDAVDDVTTIALSRVTKEKTFDVVLNEMKSNALYESFFTLNEESENNGGGTGNPVRGKKKVTGQTYAERKKAAEKEKAKKEFNYFKN